jgi:N-methylhydantoinase B
MPGDLVRLKTPGGGGHGDPMKRTAAEVSADLADGYITAWPVEGARG